MKESSYVYPTAFDQPAPGPMDVGLVGQKCFKWLQNGSKMAPKCVQNGSKMSLGGCLGASWGVLEASWSHLGAKRAPRAKNAPKTKDRFPVLGGKLGAKIHQNSPLRPSERRSIFWSFLNGLLERFGANLAPTWLPKPSQNGAKLVPKSIQVGMLI